MYPENVPKVNIVHLFLAKTNGNQNISFFGRWMFVGCGRFSSASSIRGLGTVGADLVKTVGGCKV